MDIATIAIAVIVGIGIGILSGLLGIGGGTVMVPVFKLGFGMSAIGATATSLFAIIPTAISGTVTHIRQRTCIPKLGLFAGVGGACMCPVGVWLATKSPGWLIMLAAAIVIAYSSFTMLRKAMKAPKPGGGPQTEAHDATPALQEEPTRPEPERLWRGFPIGMAAGLIAGYVGVGGGFLMVPLFLSVLGIDMKRASATSLFAISILTLPGAVEQIMLGNVSIMLALAVVAGSIPGAAIGARLVKRVPERALRFAFAGVLFVAAVLLVVQELGVF